VYNHIVGEQIELNLLTFNGKIILFLN